MSASSLAPLLHARSIAVVGGSDRAGSVGHVVLSNVRAASASHRVFAVNPDTVALDGVTWVPTVAALSEPAELAIICTPAGAVPELVEQLGESGTRVVIVITAGISRVRKARTTHRP